MQLATDSSPQGHGTHGGAAGAAAGAGIVGLLSLAAIAVALFMAQGAMGEQNCIRKAEARFPTVPVSAFEEGGRPGGGTGPLKVSFSEEREKAVQAC